jgi:flagellar P-ring protein precursor FlgI
MISAILPPFVRSGDKIDVNVTSIGDARSLVGGTLMLSSLVGPDDKVYALAQGPVSVGGFSYDLNGNLIQKNHPTSASIPDGAIIEKSITTEILNQNGEIEFVLQDPDFATADRIVNALNSEFGSGIARAADAGRVELRVPGTFSDNLVGFVTRVQSIKVMPDHSPRVVVNERTGTIVSGGDVVLGNVSITHGDIKVAISTENIVSQPIFVKQVAGSGIKTEVVPKTTIDVDEVGPISVALPKGTTINDLVMALNKLKASSRDIITIIQAIKRAGALHAELIIQ